MKSEKEVREMLEKQEKRIDVTDHFTTEKEIKAIIRALKWVLNED